MTEIILRTLKKERLESEDFQCPKFSKKLKRENSYNQYINGSRMNGKRVANFCAGPAAVSDSVLEKIRDELLSFEGAGMGIIEHSHRDVGGPVQTVMEETCDIIRGLLKVPDNYEILLMQGGAHGQFAAIPLNLLRGHKKAAYVDGGFWSHRAANEASKYCEVEMIACMEKNKDGKLVYPAEAEWKVPEDCGYIHICANETISGMEFLKDPSIGTLDCPIVADFTSTLLSRPVDVTKYGVIYASGGKNLGPSGHVVVIVNKALLGKEMPQTPSILSYTLAASTKPIPNLWYTPNIFATRALNLVVKELEHFGGIEKSHKRVLRRAKSFYRVLDNSNGFYTNNVAPEFRSLLTIPFTIKGSNPKLEAKFAKEAQACNMHQLTGHHTVGGLRVCIYNSVPDCAVEHLLKFMVNFQKKYTTR